VLRGASAAGDYEIELACRLDVDKESFPWNFKEVERGEFEPYRADATRASLEMRPPERVESHAGIYKRA